MGICLLYDVSGSTSFPLSRRELRRTPMLYGYAESLSKQEYSNSVGNHANWSMIRSISIDSADETAAFANVLSQFLRIRTMRQNDESPPLPTIQFGIGY